MATSATTAACAAAERQTGIPADAWLTIACKKVPLELLREIDPETGGQVIVQLCRSVVTVPERQTGSVVDIDDVERDVPHAFLGSSPEHALGFGYTRLGSSPRVHNPVQGEPQGPSYLGWLITSVSTEWKGDVTGALAFGAECKQERAETEKRAQLARRARAVGHGRREVS